MANCIVRGLAIFVRGSEKVATEFASTFMGPCVLNGIDLTWLGLPAIARRTVRQEVLSGTHTYNETVQA